MDCTIENKIKAAVGARNLEQSDYLDYYAPKEPYLQCLTAWYWTRYLKPHD
jgi:hypothetical protein